MGLFDIIEWVDDSADTMVYRFERYQKDIKNGAKLTVRVCQVAVFITKMCLRHGWHNTQNLPILSTLKGWKYGFNSPFKTEVYFVNTKNITNQK